MQSGVKGFRRKLLMKVADYFPNEYLGDLILVMWALKKGYKIKEVEVVWRDAGRNWNKRLKFICVIFKEIIISLPTMIKIYLTEYLYITININPIFFYLF